MGKHSARGRGPFERKHERLSHGSGRRIPARTLSEASRVNRATGDRLAGSTSRRHGALESAPARLKAERQRRRVRLRKVMAWFAVTAVIAVLMTAGGLYGYAKLLEGRMNSSVGPQNLTKLTKDKPQEPYTVLLLGADDKPGTKKRRTDTMIVARIDPKSKHVWMLSIPRDTRVNIPGYGHEKINAAYFHGGPDLAIETVSEFTGIPINHYMEVDFRGFKEIVDAMGGVWVDVPVEIDDKKAASFSRDKDVSHIDAGYQRLDGAHALVFVRSRKFVDADFSRMRHQQIFFRALADQIASRENIADLPRVVSAVTPYIGTDMKLMEMVKSALALKAAGSKNIYTATVAGEWRSPYVWPDEDSMETLIERMMAGRSFDDSSTPEPSAQEPKKKNEDVRVVVRNGSGIAGCAKQAASILKARMFIVTEVGNANQFVYEKTIVVYKRSISDAEQVAAALQPGTKLVESRGMYSFEGDVLVVIGKDWDLRKIPVTDVQAR